MLWYTFYMMPSSQKQSATPPAKAVSPYAENGAKFTQAELGQRSLARGIDRKIEEMNQNKSASMQIPLAQVMGHQVIDIPDDRSFASTHAREHIPQHVMDILHAHDIEFEEEKGDRIQHISGANFFSIIKKNPSAGGEEKEIHTFSLDEVIHDSADEEPEREPTPVVDEVSLEPEINSPLTMGTLGTVETPITSPNPPTPPVVEPPQPQLEVTPEPEPVVPEKVTIETNPEDVLQKSLNQVRAVSGREREPYYANQYRDRVTGTFTELFGNNQNINQSLFKTIRDYESMKANYLHELGMQKKSLTDLIHWERGEYGELAKLLSQKKYTLFTKLTQLFHITTPTTLETRNRIITTAPITNSAPRMSEKLGIHGMVENTPIWKKMLGGNPESNHPAIQMSENPVPSVVMMTPPEVVTGQGTTPEHHVDYAKISKVLHAAITITLGLNQEQAAEPPAPTHAPAEPPVPTSPANVQPESPSSTTVGSMNKKRPEDLFA